MGPRSAATKSGHRTQVQNVHVAKPPRFTYDLRAQAQRAMWTGGIALLKVTIATWATGLQKTRVSPGVGRPVCAHVCESVRLCVRVADHYL